MFIAELEKTQKACIGIDLGSSKCCVAVFEKGKVKILENERGMRTTPSCIAFTDAQVLSGYDAMDQTVLNPKSTIHKFKRLMGENFSKSSTDEFALFSQTSICNRDGKSAFEVSYRGDNIYLYPEQVSAMLLKKMKTMAESYLQSPVEEAVISIPVYFTNEQRKATRIAASVAGFKNTRLINDCMATALAYKDNHKHLIDETNLIVDVGGGGASLAVVRCTSNIIETKGIGGSNQFSGDDFTAFLCDLLKKKIGKAHNASDEKIIERIRTASEALKLDLSKGPKGKVQIDNLYGYSDFTHIVSREEFESTFKSLVKKKISKIVQELLKNVGINESAIDNVILVGGSTRIPFLEKSLATIFGYRKLDRTVNADEAVAQGAVLLPIYSGGHKYSAEKIVVSDLVPNCFYPKFDSKMWMTVSAHNQVIESSHGPSIVIDSSGIIFCPETDDGQSLIDTMKQQIICFDKDNKEYEELTRSLNDLEALCFKTKAALYKKGSSVELLAAEHKSEIHLLCDNIISWLDDCEHPTLDAIKEKQLHLNDKMAEFGRTESKMEQSRPTIEISNCTDLKHGTYKESLDNKKVKKICSREIFLWRTVGQLLQ